ncbi:MAG: Na+/H+ antiporter subunit E, partial [Methyloversatilis sp.]|nr:Na+/H+ antiporter subunit E [Methyloversatilis sp.]
MATTEAAHGRRWFGHPVMSTMVAAGWLMLQQSIDPGNVLTAIVLGLVIPRLVSGFIGPGVTLKAAATVLHLTGIVLWDIIMSNITVAKLA